MNINPNNKLGKGSYFLFYYNKQDKFPLQSLDKFSLMTVEERMHATAKKERQLVC